MPEEVPPGTADELDEDDTIAGNRLGVAGSFCCVVTPAQTTGNYSTYGQSNYAARQASQLATTYYQLVEHARDYGALIPKSEVHTR
jgi:hypothetical protein